MNRRIKNTSGIFIVLATIGFSIILLSDAFGNEPSKKLRVISLSPSLTETIFKIDAGELLVGRSSACDYPKKASELKVAGSFGVPNMESLVTLKPDIVVSSTLKDPALKKTIEEMGIKFYLITDKGIDDYFRGIEKLGLILNRQKAAEKEIKRLKDGLAAFESELPSEKSSPSPSVFLIIWDQPLMTVGKRSFLNDYIHYAGGRNIAKNQDIGYFKCSEEWVLVSAPEIIIFPDMKQARLKELRNRPGWSTLPAIRENRFYPDLSGSTVLRLGPRMLKAIAEIKACIQVKNKKTQTGGK